MGLQGCKRSGVVVMVMVEEGELLIAGCRRMNIQAMM